MTLFYNMEIFSNLYGDTTELYLFPMTGSSIHVRLDQVCFLHTFFPEDLVEQEKGPYINDVTFQSFMG